MAEIRNKNIFENIKNALLNENDSKVEILCKNNVMVSIPR